MCDKIVKVEFCLINYVINYVISESKATKYIYHNVNLIENKI